MAAGIDGFSSEAREEIAREISTGSLSSYQIAQRHGITKAAVDSIGKANFGAEIYGRRESLAETSLCAQVAELLSRGTSGNEIARRLGLARSTCSRFIGKVRSGSAPLQPARGGGDVKVISLPDPGEAIAPSGPSRLPAPGARPQAPLPARQQGAWPRPMAASGQGGCQRFVRMRSRGVQVSFDPLAPGAERIAVAFIRALASAQEA
jgi:DNA-binding CsgD family transcriptional regulator